MDRIVNLQMSFFGGFHTIKFETATVIDLLTALKDDGFVPGSIDISAVDIKTNKISVDSRLQLLSPDKTWIVRFMPERIDFDYNYHTGTVSYKDINILLDYGTELVSKVFSTLNTLHGNRLALNCKYILENPSEEVSKKLANSFTVPFAAYGNEPFAEWTARFNSRREFKISKSDSENSNRLVELSLLENQAKRTDVNFEYNILLSLDVNTVASNLKARFNPENLIYFSNEAKSFITDVVNEIESKC